MPRPVALIGAGAMGGAIGARLSQTGTRVLVFDLDPAKVAGLVEKGAIAAASAASAAAEADAVILSLNSPRIARAAVFGPAGVAEGARKGTLIIDMSSIDPQSTRELAKDAETAGLRWVDSPLSGGAPKAAVGQLTCMAGGEAADVAEAQGSERRAGSGAPDRNRDADDRRLRRDPSPSDRNRLWCDGPGCADGILGGANAAGVRIQESPCALT